MAYGKKEFDFANHPIEDLCFFDIETVARVPELEENTPLYDSFFYKMRYAEEAQRKDFSAYNLKALYAQKAALYPEFGKIVTISVAFVVDGYIVPYTFKDKDEASLLKRFNTNLDQWDLHRKKAGKSLAMCGVNIKFFDLRFIYIRSVVNGIRPVKGHIDLTGLKPWEVFTADLTDYWKQTSPYNAPLMCITEVLGLPSPKQDIDGSQTSEVYWGEEEGLERIAKYGEGDTIAAVNIARRLRFESILEVKPKEEGVVEEPEPAEEEQQELNLYQRLYYEGQLSKELHQEILEDITNRKLTKKDLDNLEVILKGALFRTDFINRDQDSKDVRAEKQASIDLLMKEIRKK